jgi:CheY-like chemotaxis protein
MPIMNGIEATQAIRKLERDRWQKPAMIIALTGLGSANSHQEALSSGHKPFPNKTSPFQ